MKTQIINGDILHTLRSRESLEGAIDVIVTSPPYNIGKKYGDGVNDKRNPAEYLNWMDDCLRSMRRVLHRDGSLFLNIGGTAKDPLLPLRVLSVAQEIFKVQNMITWVKSLALPTDKGEVTIGHFKPLNSPRFLNCTSEFIFHLTHTGQVALDRKAPGVGTPYSDKSNLKRWKHTEGGADMRCRGNVWFQPYTTIQSSDKHRPHPATFPVELAERAIRLHGLPEQSVVMDPFMGIGSTGRAAARAGAKEFIGIDVLEDYCDYAKKEIQTEIDNARRKS